MCPRSPVMKRAFQKSFALFCVLFISFFSFMTWEGFLICFFLSSTSHPPMLLTILPSALWMVKHLSRGVDKSAVRCSPCLVSAEMIAFLVVIKGSNLFFLCCFYIILMHFCFLDISRLSSFPPVRV